MGKVSPKCRVDQIFTCQHQRTARAALPVDRTVSKREVGRDTSIFLFRAFLTPKANRPAFKAVEAEVCKINPSTIPPQDGEWYGCGQLSGMDDNAYETEMEGYLIYLVY
jgi:hypothetical protein